MAMTPSDSLKRVPDPPSVIPHPQPLSRRAGRGSLTSGFVARRERRNRGVINRNPYKRVSEKPSSGHSGEHQPDHGQGDPRFFRAWQRLVVLAQPPVATQSG